MNKEVIELLEAIKVFPISDKDGETCCGMTVSDYSKIDKALAILKQPECESCGDMKEIIKENPNVLPVNWAIPCPDCQKLDEQPLASELRAIEIIEKSKRKHQDWLAYFERNPKSLLLKEYENIGGIKHHKLCIAEYEQAILEIKRICDRLHKAEVENKRIIKIADNRDCDSCGQKHRIDVMCPPHEVRMHGDCWYHKVIKNQARRIKELVEELDAECRVSQMLLANKKKQDKRIEELKIRTD